ncbi:MAG: FAD binding domain-containing protein [Burkholderiales bacterium]
MPRYTRPTRIDEALALLARGGQTILAGGTDFYPSRVGTTPREDVIDVTALEEVRGIQERERDWRFGATTSWTEVIEAKLPPLFDGLKLAAREVGGFQIQNSGTIAGNICNASPAADGVPALLALDAKVEIARAGGVRTVPIEQFILGPRKTARVAGELVTAVMVPKPLHAARSDFRKLGARKYLVISIAMVASVLEIENGTVRAARIAVGSCSPVAVRLPSLEQALVGKPLDEHLSACVTQEHVSLLSPIDDVRASAAYRREAALILIRRSLESLA